MSQFPVGQFQEVCTAKKLTSCVQPEDKHPGVGTRSISFIHPDTEMCGDRAWKPFSRVHSWHTQPKFHSPHPQPSSIPPGPLYYTLPVEGFSHL